MRIHLALFDPSYATQSGSFWTWSAPSLSPQLLDQIYYDIARQNLPQDPNRLTAEGLVGGFASLDGWVIGYRFGNGGRDTRGRPGRFVLVVAAIHADEAQGCDLSPLVDSDIINFILSEAKKNCPVPQPLDLVLEVSAQQAPVDPLVLGKVQDSGTWESAERDAFCQAAAICGALPRDRAWTCQFNVSDGRTSAKLQFPRESPDLLRGQNLPPPVREKALISPHPPTDAQVPTEPSPQEPATKIPVAARRVFSDILRELLQRHWFGLILLLLVVAAVVLLNVVDTTSFLRDELVLALCLVLSHGCIFLLGYIMGNARAAAALRRSRDRPETNSPPGPRGQGKYTKSRMP